MKEIVPTPELMALVDKVAGTQVDPQSIAIFENVANNTLPVKQAGSIYNGSTMTAQFLAQMLAHVKAGESVPMQTFHQLNKELPLGKVFDAQIVPLDAKNSELRTLFYITRLGNAALIDGLNSGTIDEVSSTTRPANALCSAADCGFDYLSGEADVMNWIEQTCANGHTIGKGGTHLVLSNLDRFFELSIVGLGAADHAKVLGRSKQIMARGGAEYQRLAASAAPQHSHAHTLLSASATHQEKPVMAENTGAGVAELATQLVTLSTSVGTLTAELAASKGIVTGITAERDALTAKVTELTAAVAAGAEAAKLSADHGVMLAFLQEQHLKAQTTAGVKEPKKLDVVADLIAGLTENGKHIGLILAAGGKAAAAEGSAEASTLNLAASSSYRMAR
jgi:hypothetical protein